MRFDEFETYVQNRIMPVQPSKQFDEKIKKTLETLPRIDHKYRKYKPHAIVFAAHAVVLAVLFVLLIPSSQALLTTQWLHAHSSDDEQEYIIEGLAFEPEFIADANADNPDRFVTSSYDEFVAFFEADMNIPQTILPDWQASKYICNRMFNGDGFTVLYSSVTYSDQNIKYSMKWKMDTIDQVNDWQDCVKSGQGYYVEIDGIQVYVEEKQEENGYYAGWATEHNVFSLDGPLSEQELERVLTLMIRSFDMLDEETKNKRVPEHVEHKNKMIQTGSRQEASDFLGGDFYIPNVTIEGYKLMEYYCRINRDLYREMDIVFQIDAKPNELLWIEIIDFWNYKEAYKSYEQNEEGKTIRHGGLDIYVTYNNDRLLTICLKDRVMYCISGAIDLETAKLIYDQLIPAEDLHQEGVFPL